MQKLDLTKKYKTYFTARTKPELVEIETAHFISICGKGDPSGKEFIENIEALYPVAYALKFYFKAKGNDFVVSKLEGLWWFDETKYADKTIATAPVDVPRSEWEYRLLIRLPDFITKADVNEAIENVTLKKESTHMHKVEFFILTEGKSVQLLHTGPFSTEPESLNKIGAFIKEHRLLKNGLHHEIYLSDFRRTAPEKLKTILREPVK